MKINKLLMLEVGTYNDQYQRPWTGRVDGNHMRHLQESTNFGQNFQAGALSFVAADIMKPSTTTTGRVDISQGFDSRRMCFMMEVEFPGPGGGIAVVEWLMGYTSHVGVSMAFGDSNPTFDPNMELYFNSLMRGKKVAAGRAFDTGFHHSVNGAFQLISAPNYRPSITNFHDHPHLMRPQDIFTSMSMETARGVMGDRLMDVRPTHGPERVQISSRANTIPGRYLSQVLQTWQSQAEGFDNQDAASMNSQMSSLVAEPAMSRIRSLQAFSAVSELRQGGMLKWHELVDAEESGTLEDRAVIVLAQSHKSRSKLASRGSDEHWAGNGPVTMVACQFVQAVPGFMMELMLTEFDFIVTNETLDGTWDVTVGDYQTFNDGANKSQVAAFIHRLTHELMPGLSHDGLMSLTIEARFNVCGQTHIDISMDGGPYVPFTAPSFCDGLFAPVRAPDSKTLNNFAHQLSRITTSLHQDRWSGGTGYEPHDEQHTSSPILNSQGQRYESSGAL